MRLPLRSPFYRRLYLIPSCCVQDSFDAERGAHSLPPSHPPSSAPSGDNLGSATHFHSPAQQLCVSWNSCRFDPPGMVVGGNHSVKVNDAAHINSMQELPGQWCEEGVGVSVVVRVGVAVR